jgi:hypothetical protein
VDIPDDRECERIDLGFFRGEHGGRRGEHKLGRSQRQRKKQRTPHQVNIDKGHPKLEP